MADRFISSPKSKEITALRKQMCCVQGEINTFLNASGTTSLTEYASNAAAVSGGLAVGKYYKTSGTVKIVV